MPYSVSGDTLTGAQQIPPLSYGGSTIQPSHIAIHYTAGSSLSGSISHLRKVGYSYQLLIDRDGTVVQGTPLTKRAKHAGASNWHGRDNVNDFGIGISLANIGYLDRHGSWFFNMNSHGDLITKKYSKDEVVLDTHWNGHIGGNKKGWEKYSDAQYAALREVIAALTDAFPNIIDAVGHDEIAIGRKPDPGPAFEWSRIRDLLPNRHEYLGPNMRVDVPAGDTLSVRKGPGASWGKTGTLADATEVQLRAFAYKYVGSKPRKSTWASIARAGTLDHIGFVSSKYLRPT